MWEKEHSATADGNEISLTVLENSMENPRIELRYDQKILFLPSIPQGPQNSPVRIYLCSRKDLLKTYIQNYSFEVYF